MKKLKESMRSYLVEMDNRWKKLSIKKQHQYLMVLFAGYFLLTITVIFKIWYDTGNNNEKMSINHIENPIIKKISYKDSLQSTINNSVKATIYERK